MTILSDWREFFVDEETKTMSMSRLLLFQSFYLASAVPLIDTMKHGLNEMLYGIYIGAYTGSYVGGKWASRKAAPAQTPIVLQQAPQIVNPPAKVKDADLPENTVE